MKVRCDICLEVIGEVDLETLKFPLSGAMFGSPDLPHGFPAPFHPSLDWEAMRCPFSPPPGHRPFILEDEFQVLQDGKWVKFNVPRETTGAVTPPTPIEPPVMEENPDVPAQGEQKTWVSPVESLPKRRGRPSKQLSKILAEE